MSYPRVPIGDLVSPVKVLQLTKTQSIIFRMSLRHFRCCELQI